MYVRKFYSYMDIKQTDMPPAEAAKRTKEFRCPPREQMFRLLKCKAKEERDELLDEEVPLHSRTTIFFATI